MHDLAVHERSLERSYLRLRVLMMLSSLSEAFPRQLAKSCRLDSGRLNSVLFGDGEDYSHDLALVRLGLAEVALTPHGKVYRITTAGRRKARQLAARQRRRDQFREMVRSQREIPRAWPHPGAMDAAPVPTPVGPAPSSASFSWSSFV